MEKLSRRLFFRVLPGVAAALGLAAKAKAVVIDEPVSGAAIMARARAERTAIEQLLIFGWIPVSHSDAKIGHTVRFIKPCSFEISSEYFLLTLNSPAMVDEWNALVDADRAGL